MSAERSVVVATGQLPKGRTDARPVGSWPSAADMRSYRLPPLRRPAWHRPPRSAYRRHRRCRNRPGSGHPATPPARIGRLARHRRRRRPGHRPDPASFRRDVHWSSVVGIGRGARERRQRSRRRRCRRPTGSESSAGGRISGLDTSGADQPAATTQLGRVIAIATGAWRNPNATWRRVG